MFGATRKCENKPSTYGLSVYGYTHAHLDVYIIYIHIVD